MRISDWSSDVCSSDLQGTPVCWQQISCLLCDPPAQVHPPWMGHQCRSNPKNDDAGFRTGPDQSGCPARRSEEHTSELQSLMRISYAVFCLKKKKNHHIPNKQSTLVTHKYTLTTHKD